MPAPNGANLLVISVRCRLNIGPGANARDFAKDQNFWDVSVLGRTVHQHARDERQD
jgi:hypothetical protein